jgi:hypothetical protein
MGHDLQRMRIPVAIRLSTLPPVVAVVGVQLTAAYAQWALFGLPAVPASPHFTAETATQPRKSGVLHRGH